MLVDRDHIGIFGKMNSGKSSLMNLLTQQQTSIVDATPGTTADTKIALQEIHGMGPVKLYDTAGLDEGTGLGEKKKQKVLSALKECDLVLLIINPATKQFETEQLVLDEARELDKQILVIYNLFDESNKEYIESVERVLPFLKFYPKLEISAIDESSRQPLLEFILGNFESKNVSMELLPFMQRDEFHILIIPMDEETPPGRYLRPQAMAEEYITRHWGYPVSFRLDLGTARGENPEIEKARFDAFINSFNKRPKSIITDSQAMDIMSKWAPDDMLLTTFSIMMINYVSKGRISEFYDGIKALDSIQDGDKILIAEACNHSRIKEDIGLVQIPNHLAKRYPGVKVEHNFGREFQDNKTLEQYKLIIHCGGCMISNQKLQARLRDLRQVGVPITNYGVFLSWLQGQTALDRVIQPWLK